MRSSTLGRFGALLITALLASACGDDEPETREYKDGDDFYLLASEGPRLTFQVTAGDRCLSACMENVVSCSASLDGTRVELHSLLRITEIPGVEVCPAVCVTATGTCAVEVPATGTFQVGFASRIDTVTVPVEEGRPLFGGRALPGGEP